jgi:glycerophosphoryl diester phosphodiesterase
MTTYTKRKAPIPAILLTGLLSLAGCKAAAPDISATTRPAAVTAIAPLPSMKTALSCLPDGAAMMASHRGISREWDMAENSLAGLERLIADGYRVAEIDLAGTKDGTLFLYHDGVWEEKSTGTGPVAATLTADLDTILLKNRAGEVTSERPPTFAQVLETAKDRLYLEIDFKSSARFEPVLDAIRAADMADQVVLIAYSPGQTRKLASLAPDMLLSTPSEAAMPGQLVWLGPDASDETAAKSLNDNGSIVIGRVWERNRADGLPNMLKHAKLIVTDYINQYEPIIGEYDADTYENCLTRG